MYRFVVYHISSGSGRARREVVGTFADGCAVNAAMEQFRNKMYWKYMRKYGLVAPYVENDEKTGDDTYTLQPAIALYPAQVWRLHVEYIDGSIEGRENA